MAMRLRQRTELLVEAERRLRRLSPDRLQVANDFLSYLEDREGTEATKELLKIPGFEKAYQRALRQMAKGELVDFEEIRRDV